MAYCSNCGAKLNDGAKFCSECGSPLETTSSGYKRRETIYEGMIHKCPSCGEVLNSFVSSCPSCGYEIRGNESNQVVLNLSKKINEIEGMRNNNSSKSIIKSMIKAIDPIDEKKINIIKTFPIPNTKEDVLELCIYAYSNIDYDSYDERSFRYSSKMVSEAWFSLFVQARKKAKLLLNNEDFQTIEEMYIEIKSKINKSKFKKWKMLIIPYAILIGIIGIVFLIAAGSGVFKDENKNDELKDNPNAIIISYSDEDLIYMQYTAVVELLEKQGFKNITIYETKLDVDYHEVGEVESISIDTDSNFNKGDYFLPDDLIIIYYYSNMDE